MGNVIQKVIRQMGFSEETINHFFQSTQEKMNQAIIQGDLQTVQMIKKNHNYDFSQINDKGENSLHLATRYNHLPIIKFIIQSLPKEELEYMMEDQNSYGDTPLMIATLNQKIEIMNYLINQGKAKINTKEKTGGTIFMAACANGCLELIDYLMDLKQLNIYSKNNEGQTALHRACYFGELEVVKKLIKSTKLSPLSKDKSGNNCFHIAAKRLEMSIIRYLLRQYKKYDALLIENGEDQNVLQILTNIFNKIKEEDYPEVQEVDIKNYIIDPENAPEVFHWVKKQKEQYAKKRKIDSIVIPSFSNMGESPTIKKRKATLANIMISQQGSQTNIDEVPMNNRSSSQFYQRLKLAQVENQSKAHFK